MGGSTTTNGDDCWHFNLFPVIIVADVHEIIGQWAAKLQKSGRFWLGTAPYFITTDVEVIGVRN